MKLTLQLVVVVLNAPTTTTFKFRRVNGVCSGEL